MQKKQKKTKRVPSDVAFQFSFKKVTLNEIINGIKSLDESKAAQSNSIPTKVMNENLNKQILSQYTEKNPGVKRKITGL